MAEAETLAERWAVEFRAGRHRGRADTSKDGAGGTEGMRPHELLEAALASCLAITARMALSDAGADGVTVRTRVDLDRAPGSAHFRCRVELDPPHEEHRELLLARLARSPVGVTLGGELAIDVSLA